MDPRQPPPQLPFSRNAVASPFSRPSFPPASASASASATSQQQQQQSQQQQQQQPPPPQYPPGPSHPASHPPSTGAPYTDIHARKPSDPPPYYPASRKYPPEHGPGPMPPSAHSRHPSTSSITSGPPMTRGLPPPTSPPQQHQPQQQHMQGQGPPGHQMGAPYGLPPPRPPVGPPTAFPRGRELPALESLSRTAGSGSSMSISSMLGGPPPSREPAPPPQYQQGPPSNGPGPGPGPGQGYNPQVHASPRMHPAQCPEYGSYRRPQTPEVHRLYEARDSRIPTALSPSAQNYNSTPEAQRYSTPQAYPPRGPQMPPTEHGRDQVRMPNSGLPPRPNSQPKSFQPIAPPRPIEVGRPGPEMYGHREEMRPSEEYNPERPIRVLKYDEQRFIPDRERQERERQERERHERERHERERHERERHERELELREQEQRQRAMIGSDPARQHAMHQQQEYARQMEQRAAQYPHSRDPREQGHWQRPGYEPARPPYDPAMHMPPRHQEYPPASGTHYNGPPQYLERHPQQGPPHPNSIPPPHMQSYDSPDRQRMNMMHLERQQQQQHQLPPRSREEQGIPPPSVAHSSAGSHQMFDSPRRSLDELSGPHGHQRNLLGVQEINRKGRISPLPQAVQGAQPQLSGPAGEPGIKSEFGRMFSGIGTGVGAISSPVAAGAQLPFNSGLLRREEPDGPLHEPVVEPAKPGRGKRGRKLKEEDVRDEEGSTGRQTPVGGRAKKQKHGHHHHQYVSNPNDDVVAESNIPSHHHHHHHHGIIEQTTSPANAGNTPFKHVKGSTPVPSPTSALIRDPPGAHHHHIAPRSAPKNAPPVRSPSPAVVPKPKTVVISKAVLDSVAHLPRLHLGDVVYTPRLKPARAQDARTGRPPRSAYKSSMSPLPRELTNNKLNCTLTIKIGKEHLTKESREEITRTRALWGTDIYTDDSDVIAACIHGGWIRGEWPEDVDVNLMGLDEGYSVSDVRELNKRINGTGKNGPSSQLVAPTPSSQHQPNLIVHTEPPKNGPMLVPENRDLHVKLLVLPRLEKYSATTRFGIKSREFGGAPVEDEGSRVRPVHDGLSYMVLEIRWLTNGGESQNRLRGKARRERIRKALREIEATPAWAKAPSSISSGGGEAKMLGAGGENNKAGGSGSDKENGPAGVVVPAVPTVSTAESASSVTEDGEPMLLEEDEIKGKEVAQTEAAVKRDKNRSSDEPASTTDTGPGTTIAETNNNIGTGKGGDQSKEIKTETEQEELPATTTAIIVPEPTARPAPRPEVPLVETIKSADQVTRG
ncbi:histone deacetylation protein Rxt3-domain-containing protein [Podospora fimiseda]|uniref:Histone deacetylation protein Rxt3-domain-containing protein n=1 Tax=Podospora fimiseda TaxID=252190 RepID=A0AAN7BI02_9PEZI|nr:histone deacetylation protein Rxt3-domain-containing protein [Podospora fimiseda]